MGEAPAQDVTLERVAVHFGDVAALDGVSLHVAPGELLALLGPSGCGKTTLLRVVAGFTPPAEGHVSIGGRPVDALPPHRRNIGMVFQDYALFPHLTVAGNVAFGLRMHRLPREAIAPRVQEALKLVGLSGLDQRYPRQLSGGQQQRVALARALVVNPAVLLLDEPLAALDRKLREQMRVELRLLLKQVGITVVYVTHDQEEALTLADRIAVMDHGRLQQVGPPDELYERPRSRFVSSFVGKANILPAVIQGIEPGWVTCTLADGRTVTVGGVTERLGLGAAVDVLVRPERIRFLGGAFGGDENQLDGVVVARVYLGMFTEYLVDVGPDLRVAVVAQNRSAGVDGPKAGQPVRIAWAAEDGLLIPRH